MPAWARFVLSDGSNVVAAGGDGAWLKKRNG
jgi:hypothetical protein